MTQNTCATKRTCQLDWADSSFSSAEVLVAVHGPAVTMPSQLLTNCNAAQQTGMSRSHLFMAIVMHVDLAQAW